MTQRRGHGWGPYWLPMLAFLLLIELGGRAPESAQLAFLFLKVLVPGGIFLGYALRGGYPELRGFQPSVGGLLGDVLVGLAGTVIWVVPFVMFDGLRPDDPGFDPEAYGSAFVGTALAVRAVGYAGVTPFVEEIFVRSWLLRYVDVVEKRKDFRNVPIAQFTWRSFIVVTIYFVFSHVPWEWGVMLLWTLLTMAWFYHRRHIVPLIIVHAVTNGTIFLFVVLCDGRFTDATGAPIRLWFFI